MRIAYRPYMNNTVEWKDLNTRTLKAAKALVEEDMWVYDTDNSGDDIEYVAFKTDEGYRYFKVAHEWYWTDWFSDNRHVSNEFKWSEVTKEEAAIADDRDWMDLRQRSYPEVINWPRKIDA